MKELYSLNWITRRTLFPEKRNDRTDLWNRKGESWVPVYTAGGKSPDGNESRAYLCVHEPEKTGKNEGKIRHSGRGVNVQIEIPIIYSISEKIGARAHALTPICLQPERAPKCPLYTIIYSLNIPETI